MSTVHNEIRAIKIITRDGSVRLNNKAIQDMGSINGGAVLRDVLSAFQIDVREVVFTRTSESITTYKNDGDT